MRVLYTFGYEGLKRNRHAGSKMYEAVVVPIVRLWPPVFGNHGDIRHARRSTSEEANGFCNRGGVPSGQVMAKLSPELRRVRCTLVLWRAAASVDTVFPTRCCLPLGFGDVVPWCSVRACPLRSLLG